MRISSSTPIFSTQSHLHRSGEASGTAFLSAGPMELPHPRSLPEVPVRLPYPGSFPAGPVELPHPRSLPEVPVRQPYPDSFPAGPVELPPPPVLPVSVPTVLSMEL